MRIAIIILCLCYLFFGGYNYLLTGRHYASYSMVLHIEKNHQSKFTNKNQGYPVIKEGAGQQGSNLLADIEDDDDNDPATRKFKLLAKLLYALSYSIILTWLYNRFKSPRPYSPIISYKYIKIRSLRIWWAKTCKVHHRGLQSYYVVLDPAMQCRRRQLWFRGHDLSGSRHPPVYSKPEGEPYRSAPETDNRQLTNSPIYSNEKSNLIYKLVCFIICNKL